MSEEVSKENVFQYLDTLRESGLTNMFGAGEYLQAEFSFSPKKAAKMLVEWMSTFAVRHSKEDSHG